MGAERTIVRNALIQNEGLSKKGEVQEALLPLNRRRDYYRSPCLFRVTPAGR